MRTTITEVMREKVAMIAKRAAFKRARFALKNEVLMDKQAAELANKVVSYLRKQGGMGDKALELIERGLTRGGQGLEHVMNSPQALAYGAPAAAGAGIGALTGGLTAEEGEGLGGAAAGGAIGAGLGAGGLGAARGIGKLLERPGLAKADPLGGGAGDALGAIRQQIMKAREYIIGKRGGNPAHAAGSADDLAASLKQQEAVGQGGGHPF